MSMDHKEIKNTLFAESLSEMYEILKGVNSILAEFQKIGDVAIADSIEVYINPDKFNHSKEVVESYLSSSNLRSKVHKVYNYHGYKFTVPIRLYHIVPVFKIFKKKELILAIGDQSRSLCDLLSSFLSIFKGINYDVSSMDPTPLMKRKFRKKYDTEES